MSTELFWVYSSTSTSPSTFFTTSTEYARVLEKCTRVQKYTSTEYIDPKSASHHLDKLDKLINFVSSAVYEYIEDCTTYNGAVESLNKLYVKSKNEVYGRHFFGYTTSSRAISPKCAAPRHTKKYSA